MVTVNLPPEAMAPNSLYGLAAGTVALVNPSGEVIATPAGRPSAPLASAAYGADASGAPLLAMVTAWL